MNIRVKATRHAAVWNVSYSLKERRVKPLKTCKPQSHQCPRTFKMAIHLLITELCVSISLKHTHTQIWLHLKLLYQHCDKSHKADQTALLHHLCIVTSIWLPHTKSGRKESNKLINCLFPCESVTPFSVSCCCWISQCISCSHTKCFMPQQ